MRHVVIGGGIAGVCCVEELCRLAPDDEVVLISSSTVLKVRKHASHCSRVHKILRTAMHLHLQLRLQHSAYCKCQRVEIVC
jgi:NADH dehydrogenase FAD-containing subunit